MPGSASVRRLTVASVAKRPDGQYRARYRDAAGKEHARSFRRKVDAQQWLDTITAAVQTGSYVDPGLARITVGEWAGRWLDGQAHLKSSTAERYRGILSVHVLPRWAPVRLADVAHSDVQAWVSQLGRTAAPATVRKNFRVLSLILALAVKDGRLARNPADGVNLPRVTVAERRYLSHGQVLRLASDAGEYRLVVLMLAYTGLRFGELAALRVGRLDLMRRRAVIAESVTEVGGVQHWGTPKGHERREVPIPRSLVDELAGHVAGRTPDASSLASVVAAPSVYECFAAQRLIGRLPAWVWPGCTRTSCATRLQALRSPRGPTSRWFSRCSATSPRR